MKLGDVLPKVVESELANSCLLHFFDHTKFDCRPVNEGTTDPLAN